MGVLRWRHLRTLASKFSDAHGVHTFVLTLHAALSLEPMHVQNVATLNHQVALAEEADPMEEVQREDDCVGGRQEEQGQVFWRHRNTFSGATDKGGVGVCRSGSFGRRRGGP